MVIFLDIDDTINDFTIQMNAIEPMWFLSSTLARTLFFCHNDVFKNCHYLNSHTILIDDSQKTLSEAHSLGYKAFDLNQISPKELLDQFSPTVSHATQQKLQQIQKGLEVQGALEAQEAVEEKIETKTQVSPSPIWAKV
ncbi:hypothetical protein KVE05_00610 [Helicobacter pylori]|nr:hypothetical protein KVE05_00610 [Helicobacter pylori]